MFFATVSEVRESRHALVEALGHYRKKFNVELDEIAGVEASLREARGKHSAVLDGQAILEKEIENLVREVPRGYVRCCNGVGTSNECGRIAPTSEAGTPIGWHRLEFACNHTNDFFHCPEHGPKKVPHECGYCHGL